MRAIISRNTVQKIKVSNQGGILQPTSPLTLKNQIKELHTIEDIGDVSEVDVTTGSTLVYNSENDKYEVRKLNATDISGSLDGGEF